ncbi:MAG: TldD/PmbA family protein, partial [Myxococcales bacterium]|nr:TldD/PmbA family protein [Myxococcales bacterium]
MIRDPSNALDWFAVDRPTLSRVLGELSARGADAADLYFQYSRDNSFTLEDGIISRASTSVDQGVGLRCVIGDQTGFAFTEDLAEAAMRAAARTAASIAHGGHRAPPQEFVRMPSAGDFYPEAPGARDVGVADKLPILERAAAITHGLDPAITKVTIHWGDSEELIVIADAEGQIHVDKRPMSRLWVLVTAQRNGEVQTNMANVAARRGLEWYTDARLEAVAREAVERTLILFDARRPPAGEMPVVLAAGASGILLHEAIGHGM